VPPGAHAGAIIQQKAPGVLCGLPLVEAVFATLDPGVKFEPWVEEGSWSGDAGEGPRVVARLEGPARAILTGERTALNFLCHLSGVATATHRFVLAAGDAVRVLDTRKTLPGLRSLEKAAVRAGGGANHRGSLSDLVLLKDNHLAGIGIGAAVQRARDLWPGRAVEVECDRLAQVEEAVAAGASMVLLDNMAPDEIRGCVALVRRSAPHMVVEVSGGVTLENIRAYADAGPDVISTSVITQSAPALDIAFDIASDVTNREGG
jgi:nicotinate-nucleotide pyrophosphorylase (carboxylating)